MKIQIVCLANSSVEGGRSLVGIQLENGIPIIEHDGPRWVILSIGVNRKNIPTGLVIDILPGDILEMETTTIISHQRYLQSVQFDPYSIRFLGRMVKELIHSFCTAQNSAVPFPGNRPDQKSNYWLLKCDDCFAVFDESTTNKPPKLTMISFKYQGASLQFPITDPFFHQVAKIEPDILSNAKSHYLVLLQKSAMGRKDEMVQVVAILE